jgi:hypothetical protein
MSERVVWLGDTGPEFGSVRWIGTLPDKPDEVLVGVEFVSRFFFSNCKVYCLPISPCALI